MSEVQFATQPFPEIMPDQFAEAELNARLGQIMAFDIPGVILRQCGAVNAAELAKDVNTAATDFDLEFLNYFPFEFEKEQAGPGRGLHNDVDNSPPGARRINITYLEKGPLDVTMFRFSPRLASTVLSGEPLSLPHQQMALYKRGLVDRKWLSPFAYHGVLQTGDGFIFADVLPHDFKNIAFPRRSKAYTYRATRKR